MEWNTLFAFFTQVKWLVFHLFGAIILHYTS